ncbi:hypothetical protein BGZ83_008466 [Gryganskiella cystojenkinii]|nr:hypothetical protein BGZ83_008466 [Gryganskiella cystojenkinii]
MPRSLLLMKKQEYLVSRQSQKAVVGITKSSMPPTARSGFVTVAITSDISGTFVGRLSLQVRANWVNHRRSIDEEVYHLGVCLLMPIDLNAAKGWLKEFKDSSKFVETDLENGR